MIDVQKYNLYLLLFIVTYCFVNSWYIGSNSANCLCYSTTHATCQFVFKFIYIAVTTFLAVSEKNWGLPLLGLRRELRLLLSFCDGKALFSLDDSLICSRLSRIGIGYELHWQVICHHYEVTWSYSHFDFSSCS